MQGGKQNLCMMLLWMQIVVMLVCRSDYRASPLCGCASWSGCRGQGGWRKPETPRSSRSAASTGPGLVRGSWPSTSPRTPLKRHSQSCSRTRLQQWWSEECPSWTKRQGSEGLNTTSVLFLNISTQLVCKSLVGWTPTNIAKDMWHHVIDYLVIKAFT